MAKLTELRLDTCKKLRFPNIFVASFGTFIQMHKEHLIFKPV